MGCLTRFGGFLLLTFSTVLLLLEDDFNDTAKCLFSSISAFAAETSEGENFDKDTFGERKIAAPEDTSEKQFNFMADVEDLDRIKKHTVKYDKEAGSFEFHNGQKVYAKGREPEADTIDSQLREAFPEEFAEILKTQESEQKVKDSKPISKKSTTQNSKQNSQSSSNSFQNADNTAANSKNAKNTKSSSSSSQNQGKTHKKGAKGSKYYYKTTNSRIPWEKLGPKFWVALCTTSSILSGLIFLFEVWYCKHHGTSFIEQLAIQYLAPWVSPNDLIKGQGQQQQHGHSHGNAKNSSKPGNSGQSSGFLPNIRKHKIPEGETTETAENAENAKNGGKSCPTVKNASIPPSKHRNNHQLSGVAFRSSTHRNYMRLLRGAEYRRFQLAMNYDPITDFSRIYTNRDWQETFSCGLDKERRCDEIMHNTWMLGTTDKINMAKRALEVSREAFEQSISDMNDRATQMVHKTHIDAVRPDSLDIEFGNLKNKNLNSLDTMSDSTVNSDDSKNDRNGAKRSKSNSKRDEKLKSMKAGYITPAFDCALACMLIAEEDAETVGEADKWFRRALLGAEYQKEKSSETRHKSIEHENRYHRDYKLVCHIKSRLALCCRRLGKLRESLKLYREITRDYHANSMSIDSLYDSMLEVFLEQQSYADVHNLIQRYEGTTHQSTTVVYTQALMKVRAVCGSNMFDPVSLVNNKKLTDAEKQAIEAVHSAVEYNPHVPQYLLEQKPLILPGEHIMRRGDSDAIAYGFWHMRHWKKIPGALTFLEYTWQSAFKNLPHHIDRGHRYNAYPAHNYEWDQQVLPEQVHKVSKYPAKNEWWAFGGLISCNYPFFIILTFFFCVLFGVLAAALHYSPMITIKCLNAFWMTLKQPFNYVVKQWLNLVQLNINILQKILKDVLKPRFSKVIGPTFRFSHFFPNR